MKHIQNKKIYKRALFAMILFFASFHLVLLLVAALVKNDLGLINLFNIIDLDLFFPAIGQGPVSIVLAVLTTAIVYLIILQLIIRSSNSL